MQSMMKEKGLESTLESMRSSTVPYPGMAKRDRERAGSESVQSPQVLHLNQLDDDDMKLPEQSDDEVRAETPDGHIHINHRRKKGKPLPLSLVMEQDLERKVDDDYDEYTQFEFEDGDDSDDMYRMHMSGNQAHHKGSNTGNTGGSNTRNNTICSADV